MEHNTKGKPCVIFYDRVQAIIEYVNDNYTQPTLCKDDLVNRFFLSQTNFMMIFKELTGKPYKKYLDDLRIGHAIRLMKHENSFKIIAYASGFSSYQNFNRTFKRIVKTTPTEYRMGPTTLPEFAN